jgi:hypothetical protein
MRKIVELVGINPAYISKKLYGVEIEVEGVRLPKQEHLPEQLWRVERDTSLKTAEAWEYVMQKPRMIEGVNESIDILQSAYNNRNSIVHDSVRAGVHVHMNVQDWNIKQLMTFAVCYYMVEDILLHWCGENREGNLFCLRTRDAEYVLFKVFQALNERKLSHLKYDLIRYSSLNYCSLFKYGTVEFRGMRGTPDLSLIKTWVAIIDQLRTNSLNFSSPTEVLEWFSGEGEDGFVAALLPNYHHLFKCPDKSRVIRNAARRVQMLAFGIDWKALETPPINPFNTAGGL